MQHADTVSSDGRWLVYHEHDPDTRQDLWVLDLEGQEEPRAFLRTEFAETDAQLSPDGRWLAYQSDETGSREIYVQPFPGPGGKYQISAGGGSAPVWVRQEELIFRSGRQVMSVAIETSPSFSAATPEPLFEGIQRSRTRDYDLTRDGQQFVILAPESEERGTQQVNIVLNWFDELERLAPSE